MAKITFDVDAELKAISSLGQSIAAQRQAQAEAEAAAWRAANPVLKIIKVQSTFKTDYDGGTPVALWERDFCHPTIEVYIADDNIHEVALTEKVRAALINGALVRVEA